MKMLKDWIKGIDYPDFMTPAGAASLAEIILKGETPRTAWERISTSVACHLGKPELAEQFFNDIWSGWLSLATPVAANSGTKRGLPISCFGSYVPDTMEGIMENQLEVAMLSKNGGGVSSYFGDLRPRGATIGENGVSNGSMQFIKGFDSYTNAISQGKTRRGATAMISKQGHGDFAELLRMRRPTNSADEYCSHTNQGFTVTDEFMNKVVSGDEAARSDWAEIIRTRAETGEPYLMFVDTVNRTLPTAYQVLGLQVKSTNICCLTGDTLIVTKSGVEPIRDLVGRTVDIWDGLQWVSNSSFRKTAEDDTIYMVTLRDRRQIQCNARHRHFLEDGTVVRTADLKIGMVLEQHAQRADGTVKASGAYLKGFMLGDGSCMDYGNPLLWLYAPKAMCADRLVHSAMELTSGAVRTNARTDLGFMLSGPDGRQKMTGLAPLGNELRAWGSTYKQELPLEVYSWDEGSVCEFIAGYLDADGTCLSTNTSPGYQVSSVDKALLASFQTLLRLIGVESRLELSRKAGMNNIKGGEVFCKDLWRLNISSVSARALSAKVKFSRLLNVPTTGGYKTNTAFSEVVAIEEQDIKQDTYCTTVPSTSKYALANGIMTGNTEILLHNDADHTFVCCISSVNLAKYDEWAPQAEAFIGRCIYFLEGVMTEFITKAKGKRGFERAIRFAEKSRALGLGVLGWHTFLQQKNLPMDSLMASVFNKKIFKQIQECAVKASQDLAKEYGEPEWCKGTGMRHTHLLAVAPTATNSVIAGQNSPGIEPIRANIFMHKTGYGNFEARNPTLEMVLQSLDKNNTETWSAINSGRGSVQHLDFLSDEQKATFLTATEIDQNILVSLAAERQPFIDQGQSLNLFFPKPPNQEQDHKSFTIWLKYVNKVHLNAWRSGLRTLYYMRSEAIIQADTATRIYERQSIVDKEPEECRWCS